MKLVITHSYDESAKLCADMIAEVYNNNPCALMGLATGSTPEPVYEYMVAAHKSGEVDYSCARAINLDEYIGVDPLDENSYNYYMNHRLFDHINIKPENTLIPNGKKPPEDEIARLNKYLDNNTMHIQLLSCGTNGHIGFNEPDDVFYDKYHVVYLSEETIMSNARLFNASEEVPRSAVTMGIGGIMRAEKIAFLATGEEKRRAMKAILEKGDITPQIQGTILKFHPDCTIFLDKDLADGIVPDMGIEVIYR